MRNVEEFTRRLGPPGALTTFANICDPAVRLGVHDWVRGLFIHTSFRAN